MPPSERRALLLLLGLAIAGQAVRHLATRPGEPPGQVGLLSTLSPGSPLAQRDSAMRRTRPLAPGERVDLDTAAVDELARLPKVGLGLAKTIHAYRQAHGSFGSLEVLDRVPGVGPGLLKTLGPHVSFSGAAAAGTAASRQGTGPCAGITATRPLCSAVPLNLNTATATDLDSLPGIGPAKAAAILQYRERHGAFVALEQLAEVPGFGVGAVARLRDRVTVR
jgi:competence ComEA-like helix-hairpin-helix protein